MVYTLKEINAETKRLIEARDATLAQLAQLGVKDAAIDNALTDTVYRFYAPRLHDLEIQFQMAEHYL